MSEHTIMVIWVIEVYLCISSVYSYHLFLISCASVRSLPFLSFIVPIVAWNVPLVSLIFLKISLVFPILLFSSVPLHCSLEKTFLLLLVILWISAFSWVHLSLSPLPFTSLYSAICKAASDSHFAFLHFFFLGWFWSLPAVQCYEPLSIVFQVLCLDQALQSSPLNLFVTSTV